MSSNKVVSINPETKIGELLDAYPGIDEVLIGISPAFEKLRNPILRKTVAKVATLEQAARIGSVPLPELLAKLRAHTGQSGPAAAAAERPADDAGGPPEWVREENVKHTIDADAMLETGEHPLGKIRTMVSSMPAGEIVKLTSSFRPEPLLVEMAKDGMAVYSEETGPGRHTTWISPPLSG